MRFSSKKFLVVLIGVRLDSFLQGSDLEHLSLKIDEKEVEKVKKNSNECTLLKEQYNLKQDGYDKYQNMC